MYNTPPPRLTFAVSVVIPMFNAEEYIGECLDSLLNQTMQDFEVIVVDDCSTDNSVDVVKDYKQQFSGRLTFAKTKTNSGGDSVPRNVGLKLTSGKYVFFLDADDALTPSALKKMYSQAKEKAADVVYCERYFTSSGVEQDFKDNVRPATDKMIQKPPFVDIPTLESDDLSVRFDKWLKQNYWLSPSLEFVKRDLLIDNEITFPELVGSSEVNWAFKVLFCAKRFLRVPNAYYIKRSHVLLNPSQAFTASEHAQRAIDRTIRALKDMDDFMERFEFFKDNPAHRYEVLDRFISADFVALADKCKTTPRIAMYNACREKFGAFLGDYDVLLSGLCTNLYNKCRQANNSRKSLEEAQRRIATLEKELKRLKHKE